ILGEDATIERDRHEGEGVALFVSGTIPIGHENTIAGEGLPQIDGGVIADFHLLDFGIGAMLGFRHRFAEPRWFNSSFRNQLHGVFAIQAPIPFLEKTVGIGEVDVTTDAENPFGNSGSTSGEWRIGWRNSSIRDIEWGGAVGTGTASGVGAPIFRGVLWASWLPRVHDKDGDGIIDEKDECITLPEDMDGFEDQNGCPEPDNDRDLVPDIDDRCPNEASEEGRDLDDDGCTDPLVDSDGDALEDRDDNCPQQPEDPDQFQDQDGCPDPDNDNDTIPDDSDQCPQQPEDPDQFQDQDGCPEIDNDRDGVPDAFDRCPDQMERWNGVEDEDGCDDRGGHQRWNREGSDATRGEEGTSQAMRWRASFAVRGNRLSRGTEAAIEQLRGLLIAAFPRECVLSIGWKEDKAQLIETLKERLQGLLSRFKAESIRFEVERSDALPPNQAELRCDAQTSPPFKPVTLLAPHSAKFGPLFPQIALPRIGEGTLAESKADSKDKESSDSAKVEGGN
ncbi:MAG: hypothetical protein N2515_07145, partial [Deltaproteobacteria bacterium]|nr:hypothetical protein [Deltaproteobacteria bacterium]